MICRVTREDWEHRTEWSMVGIAVLFIAAYAVQVLAQPSGSANALVQTVLWGTWAIFAVDYVVRLLLARPRGTWFIHHLHDAAMVVLPMLRPLRLLRLLALLSLLQRAAGSTLRGRVVLYTAGTTTVLVGVASLAVLDAERGVPGADIVNYGRALWWALVSITTVGYGDLAPITTIGRVVAVGLMIAGIALLGTVTATLASWLVDRIAQEDEARQAASAHQVTELNDRMTRLQATLDSLVAERVQSPPGSSSSFR